MQKYNRICCIVLDSVGIGQAFDAEKFGDINVNTLGNISSTVGLDLPNLQKLGLGNIAPLKTVAPTSTPKASYSMMQEVGDGKDTMTGHWEMMGCTLHQGFRQYIKNGFDQELIDIFTDHTKRPVLANKEANGMKVIKEYYKEHFETGGFIVYTSVDSTFQVAAHEDVISLEELYAACEFIREVTKDPKYNIARVIARPFTGSESDFSRTKNRHDYALDPFEETVLDKLVANNLDSIAIGKIADIFNGRGISQTIKTGFNDVGIDKTIEVLKQDNINGFIFTNLVDFDSMYGHPRDVVGYKNCLESFDKRLDEILDCIKEDDLLIITADHGNDPTYKGNDHTREFVPLLVYSPSIKKPTHFTRRMSFEDLGQTICENFNLKNTKEGTSFLNDVEGK